MPDVLPDAPPEVRTRPFYDEPWPAEQRAAAQALWDWHLALKAPEVPALDGDDLVAFFEAEADKAAAAEALDVIPASVCRAAYDAAAQHDLPLADLAAQVRAARRWVGAVRFETSAELRAFMHDWNEALARTLAELGGFAHSWRQRPTAELARGFFLTGRVLMLPHDLRRDRVFIPLDDLDQMGVPVEALQAGRIDESMRRLMWKQTVRARNAFGHGVPLMNDLPRRFAAPLKRWALGALELLGEVERRGYDVWHEPIRLNTFQRLQVRYQARFGKATFTSR